MFVFLSAVLGSVWSSVRLPYLNNGVKILGRSCSLNTFSILQCPETFSSQFSSRGTVQSEGGVNQACHITKPVTMKLLRKMKTWGKRYSRY